MGGEIEIDGLIDFIELSPVVVKPRAGHGLAIQAVFLCCSLEENFFFFGKPHSLVLSSLLLDET